MSKMTFHESYGDVTIAQLRAYRKYNVSPSDHDDLVDKYGDDHDAITQAVIRLSPDGMFRVFDLWCGR